jgi:hypothetical protein
MMRDAIREELETLLLVTDEKKKEASENNGAVIARRWAVLHTELEKSLAYYVAFLEPKESES